jgi:hypothetical protein
VAFFDLKVGVGKNKVINNESGREEDVGRGGFINHITAPRTEVSND